MNRLISRINLLFFITLTVLATSCSKSDNQDAEALLATVPSNASIVGIADISSILEEGGCKISGSKIKCSPELQQAIETIKDPNEKKSIEKVLNGKSGVRPTSIVFFTVGSSIYVSGLLDNTADFKSFIESETKEKFVKTGEVEICKEFAVVGDQFWACENSSEDSATHISEFTKLSKQQSYLGGEYSDTFLKMDDDIRVAVDIYGMTNNLSLDFKERAMYSTFINSLFKDATYSLLTVDFDKKKIDFTAKILDSKGNVADFNLPTSQIEGKTIEELGGTANVFGALSVNSRLVKKINEIVKSISGLVPQMYAGFIEPLDGTLCIAASADKSAMRGIITTNGKAANELTSILSGAGKVDKEGKYIYINKGTATGSGISAEEAAKLMKGAWGAVVYSAPEEMPEFKHVSSCVMPDGKGISLKVQAVANDKNAVNAIISQLASQRVSK